MTPFLPLTVGCIGAGHMAQALLTGMVKSDLLPDMFRVYDVDAEKAQSLSARTGVRVCATLAEVVEASWLCIAVKPQQVLSVCRQVAPLLQHTEAVLSIAAGVRVADIQAALSPAAVPLVRIMPNLAAAAGAATTGIYTTDDEVLAQARVLFARVGEVFSVADEALLDVVTAVSGSGPAYFLYMMQAMVDAAVALGLSADEARAMVVQTAAGAAQLAKVRRDDSCRDLYEAIAVPGGTTEQALQLLNNAGVDVAIRDAIGAATQQARAIATTAGRVV